MSREQMIAELKKIKPSYNYNRYEDAQIFRMYQRYVLDKNTPKGDLVTQQVEPTTSVEKSIEDYEKEYEDQVGYKICDTCGTRLNDIGTCPKCDDGEEDLNEAIPEVHIKESLDNLPANEYSLIYYENSSCRERRPTTLEDIENDWPEITFRADSDVEAFNKAFSHIYQDEDNEFIEDDLDDIDEIDSEVNFDESLYEEDLLHNSKLTTHIEADDDFNLEKTCVLCGNKIFGYGNNASPVADGTCCDLCNMEKVIPARLNQFRSKRK